MADFANNINAGQLIGAMGAVFIFLLNFLLTKKGSLSPKYAYPHDIGSQMRDNFDLQFDFVIVGTGAAGCVLANRLTEHEDWKILLVEAGDDPNSTSEVFHPSLLKTNEDWQFATEASEQSCQGMLKNECRIPKGRVLRGTSSINNLLYMRAIPKDFDNWVNMGNVEWGTENMNFFYKRLENFKGSSYYPIRYGTSGALSLDGFNSKHYVKSMIFEAANRLGYGRLKEGDYLGYIENVGILEKGTRHNIAKAFLSPIKHRPNFFVMKKCYAIHVKIPNRQEKRVREIKCRIKNTVWNIKVRREVILSMGGINTPKLLMLSGIGPEETLKEANISIVANLKVGQNMQEHLGVPVFVGMDENNAETLDQLDKLVDATYLNMTRRQESSTTTNINDLVGFINTRNKPYEYPNVAIYHYHFYPSDATLKFFLDNIGYKPEIKKSILKHNQNQTLVMFLPTLLKPKSRGHILINTKNPFQNPIIKANFLTDALDEDLMTLVSGFKFIMRMVEKPPFIQHKAKILHIDIPNCRNLKFPVDFFIKCHIKNLAYPQGDVVGTTKMGPLSDPTVVVNDDLVVKGVKGLRIVDASIMPEIVSVNILATSAMIADKISECIKATYIENYILRPQCVCMKNYN